MRGTRAILVRVGDDVKRIFRWVANARLPGEGMHPLSNPTHHRITQAALEALPARDREFLAPEADLLVWTYCGFPDMNWHWYGTFARDPGIPPDRRLPDIRREWEIARYCAWNSLTREGRWYPHWPPDTLEAAAVHFRRAGAALAEGSYEDAVRILGASLHYAEDTGSPSHAAHIDPPLHLPMERIDRPEMLDAITIPEYAPGLLGSTADAALHGIQDRGAAVAAVSRRAAGEIRVLCEADEQNDAQALMVPCARECARYAADILHTFCALAGHARPPARLPAPGQNLLPNPDLARLDDVPEIPHGWYIHWNDLTDREGSACLDRTEEGAALKIASPPGQGIHWRVPWPRAARVQAGVRLRLSLVYRTEGAQGSNNCSIRFYAGNTARVGTPATRNLHPADRWSPAVLEAEAPEGAVWARVSLEAAASRGSVWFRDLRLERVDA